MMLIAMTSVTVVHAGPEEAKQVFPENDTAGFLPVDVLTIDLSIKESSPWFQFLILSAEGKENQLSDVGLAIDFLYPNDPQGEVLKVGLQGKMKEIWDKYPVVFETKPGGPGYPTYGGSIVTVRFASPLQDIRLTDEENDVIKKSALLMNEAYTRKNLNKSSGTPARIHSRRNRNLRTLLFHCGICNYQVETGWAALNTPLCEGGPRGS